MSRYGPERHGETAAGSGGVPSRSTIACYHRRMKRAAVLGAGAWGTALAKVLSDKGERVSLYTRRPELPGQIAEKHVNERYLPGVELGGDLVVTTDLQKAIADATLIVLAVPSHALREVVRDAYRSLSPDAPIVSATKGIENDSLMLMGEVVLDVAGEAMRDRMTILSGPSFAREVALG